MVEGKEVSWKGRTSADGMGAASVTATSTPAAIMVTSLYCIFSFSSLLLFLVLLTRDMLRVGLASKFKVSVLIYQEVKNSDRHRSRLLLHIYASFELNYGCSLPPSMVGE
jgi:uncharacterized protein (DUF58 family)